MPTMRVLDAEDEGAARLDATVEAAAELPRAVLLLGMQVFALFTFLFCFPWTFLFFSAGTPSTICCHSGEWNGW